jgi:uracil-DNA glycosylase
MRNTLFPSLLKQHTKAAFYHIHIRRPLPSRFPYNMSLKRSANTSSSPAAAKKPRANGSITSFFGAPKPKEGASTPKAGAPPPPPTVKFNKEKWVSSLTAEQKELLQLEINTLDESWLAHLKDEVVSPEFLNLKRFLKKEKESKAIIFPPENDIYSW